MKKVIIIVSLLAGVVAALFGEILARINARHYKFTTLNQHNVLESMDSFIIGYNAGHLVIVTHGYEGGGIYFGHNAGDGVDRIIEVAQYSTDLSMEIWQVDLICCFPGDQWGCTCKTLGEVPIVSFSTAKNICLVRFVSDGAVAYDSEMLTKCYTIVEQTEFMRFCRVVEERGILVALKLILYPPQSK